MVLDTVSQQKLQRVQPSLFECEFCAARERTATIAYDRLGYPICPHCTFHHGPTNG